jgi:Kdo2-lipid IVA lauroyltransferase/acyltransferase
MLVYLFRLLARLPLPLLHAIGALLGRLVYLASPTYRNRLKDNIGRAGYAQYLSSAIRETGKNVLELPFVWFAAQERIQKATHAANWDLVQAAAAEGRGLIFLTPHLGCFEISAQFAATKMPLTVLYRPPRKDILKPLIEGARERHHLRLAPANLSGVRTLLKTLKHGGAIGLLPDQVPQHGEGVWANFFGKPAYTMTLPAKLQQMTGAPIILAFAERQLGSGGYTLHLARLDAQLDGTPEQQARAINQAMEQLIARCPAQYFWSYNRYKVPTGVPAPIEQKDNP